MTGRLGRCPAFGIIQFWNLELGTYPAWANCVAMFINYFCVESWRQRLHQGWGVKTDGLGLFQMWLKSSHGQGPVCVVSLSRVESFPSSRVTLNNNALKTSQTYLVYCYQLQEFYYSIQNTGEFKKIRVLDIVIMQRLPYNRGKCYFQYKQVFSISTAQRTKQV